MVNINTAEVQPIEMRVIGVMTAHEIYSSVGIAMD